MSAELGVAYVSLTVQMKGASKDIQKALNTSTVASAVKSSGTSIGSKLMDGIKSTIGKGFSGTVSSIGTNLASTLRSLPSNAASAAMSLGHSIVGKIGDGIKAAPAAIGGALTNVVKGAAVAALAAVGAAGAGVANLGKSAVSSYATFEQLEGGISKMFGTAGQALPEFAAQMGVSVEEAQDKWLALSDAESLVMQNAKNAKQMP